MSHYDTLGVAPDADQATIRSAYRHLARRYHPDSGRSDAAAMAGINEAYRILRDPARRARYDASLRPAPGAAARSEPSRSASEPPRSAPVRSTFPPSAPGPARFPWKLVVFMFTVGAAVVLVLAALSEPSSPPPADNVLEPGSCVQLEPNGDAREVVCGRAELERIVAALVPFGEACPDGTEAHRDQQGRGTACLERLPSSGPT